MFDKEDKGGGLDSSYSHLESRDNLFVLDDAGRSSLQTAKLCTGLTWRTVLCIS